VGGLGQKGCSGEKRRSGRERRNAVHHSCGFVLSEKGRGSCSCCEGSETVTTQKEKKIYVCRVRTSRVVGSSSYVGCAVYCLREPEEGMGMMGGDGEYRPLNPEPFQERRVDDLGLEREKESQKLDNTPENKRECAR